MILSRCDWHTFDHNWVITNRYTHYVKPEHFTQDQLKPLIWYITGIDTTQIMSAPPMSQIREQIQQYFGDNVVIIWHNISFDLAMVGKHHKLEYTEAIDTMDVARTLLHYQRSYSLEILHQQLLLQPRYQWYLAWLEIKAHDALSDCYTNLCTLPSLYGACRWYDGGVSMTGTYCIWWTVE